ncbi:hypothetical protein S245_049760, partial [Arachis hypogaea]
MGAPGKRTVSRIFEEAATRRKPHGKSTNKVPYIDAKVASTHVLPALITLGSDQNLNVKYASIDAFGAVAQHLKMTR